MLVLPAITAIIFLLYIKKNINADCILLVFAFKSIFANDTMDFFIVWNHKLLLFIYLYPNAYEERQQLHG